jgi:hypothetical protein
VTLPKDAKREQPDRDHIARDDSANRDDESSGLLERLERATSARDQERHGEQRQQRCDMSQNNFGNPLPINAYDNWKRTSLNLKGIYLLDKQWSITGGYAYERTRYSDIAYDGYQYTIPFPAASNNTGQSYLNGYRAFTNANANIFYVLATFKF